jgi:hypothetical protein
MSLPRFPVLHKLDERSLRKLICDHEAAKFEKDYAEPVDRFNNLFTRACQLSFCSCRQRAIGCPEFLC